MNKNTSENSNTSNINSNDKHSSEFKLDMKRLKKNERANKESLTFREKNQLSLNEKLNNNNLLNKIKIETSVNKNKDIRDNCKIKDIRRSNINSSLSTNINSNINQTNKQVIQDKSKSKIINCEISKNLRVFFEDEDLEL